MNQTIPWITIKRQIKERDQYACQRCFDRPERLEAHHWLPLKEGGTDDLDNLITLCPRCHGIVEVEYRDFYRITNQKTKYPFRIFRRITRSGHVLIYKPNHPNCDRWGFIKEHRWVVEEHIDRYLTRNEHIHHINGIKTDNRIENLQILSISEHAKIHNKSLWNNLEYKQMMRQISKEQWNNPEYKEKMNQVRKTMWNNPQRRKQQSQISKELWNNPEYWKIHSRASKSRWDTPAYRERLLKKMNTPEFKEGASQRSKERWSNPELQKHMSKTRKNIWRDPKHREKQSLSRKAYWNSLEGKERTKLVVKALKAQWDNPEFRKKQSEIRKASWTPERRKAQGQRSKARWNNPEIKHKHSLLMKGQNNPFYGKKHSEETKLKMRKHRQKKNRTNNNSNLDDFIG